MSIDSSSNTGNFHVGLCPIVWIIIIEPNETRVKLSRYSFEVKDTKWLSTTMAFWKQCIVWKTDSYWNSIKKKKSGW